MLYAIIPLGDDRDAEDDKMLGSRIVTAIDPTAYVRYAPHLYLVSYNGTSAELAEKVGFTNKEDRPDTGLVLSIGYYNGLAIPDIWEWIQTRQDG